MTTLNLTAPTSWSQLTEQQLLHVFTCIAADYTPTQIKTLALMRWNNIEVLDRRDPSTYYIRKDKKHYLIPTEQVAAILPQLDFLTQIPDSPVRLPRIKGHTAIAANFQEVPFEKYIMCDNLYQGFLHTHQSDLLLQMAGILYNTQDISGLTKAQEVSIFYWWASLKQHLAKHFPHFFSPAADSYSDPDLYRQLSTQMNAQIRALTKGDITKEKEILSLDTWRALTELDAQAHEYEQLKNTKS